MRSLTALSRLRQPFWRTALEWLLWISIMSQVAPIHMGFGMRLLWLTPGALLVTLSMVIWTANHPGERL